MLRVYTIQEYGALVKAPLESRDSLEKIQDFNNDLWDFPLDEIIDRLNQLDNLVLVITEHGLRACEY